MKHVIYSVQGPIGLEEFHKLLEASAPFCSTMNVVLRNHHPHGSPVLEGILQQLKPFFIKEVEQSIWPGTIVYNETARVLYYRFDHETRVVLKKLGIGLLDWLAPDAPEGLSLLRADGSPFFVSISHEEDCYFKIADEELELIKINYPQVHALLSADL